MFWAYDVTSYDLSYDCGIICLFIVQNKNKRKRKRKSVRKNKRKKIKIVNIQASYNMLRDLNMEMTSLMNFSSSLLFLGIMSLEDWTNSSVIEIVIVRGT